MGVVSEPYDIILIFIHALGSIDLLIDKHELVRNKVSKARGLSGSHTMDVGVRRQTDMTSIHDLSMALHTLWKTTP